MVASLKAFDSYLRNLQLQYKNFVGNSIKATVHILYELGFFDRFENKDEIFRDYFSLKKIRIRKR